MNLGSSDLAVYPDTNLLVLGKVYGHPSEHPTNTQVHQQLLELVAFGCLPLLRTVVTP